MEVPMRATRIAAVLLLLGACSSSPVEVDRVAAMRQQVETTRTDPVVGRYAPVQLHDAEQSLALAEQASKAGDVAQTDHQLYMTDQRLQIARSRADAEASGAERQTLAQQRSQMQLESAQQRAARLEQEVEGLRARQTAQGTVYTLTDVLFETGKAQLKPGAFNRLQPLASYLKANPDKTVTVQGFTDNTGSAQTNLQLSQRRAEAVRDYLVGEGIEPSRVVARGMGEDYPLASNATPAGRQQNRRVEVLVSEAPR
jgi:outer membrane protein OmpA-like peptidoglycan-associated protein